MTSEVISISLKNIFGSVNCYLVKAETVFILIDSGWANKRTSLEKELNNAGCTVNNLKLIVLTHGDFDHTGNAAYLMKVLKEIEHGTSLNITSRGKVVARLVPPDFVRIEARKKLEEIGKTAKLADIISPILFCNNEDYIKPETYI
jgi:glyoxylase-like metal-dependent hydrolase (beta-lactamase superfamily II)